MGIHPNTKFYIEVLPLLKSSISNTIENIKLKIDYFNNLNRDLTASENAKLEKLTNFLGELENLELSGKEFYRREYHV